MKRGHTENRDFAERHHLQVTDIVEYERLPIRASSAANILVNAGYERLTDDALSDPAVGLLLNMLHRDVELVEAAIVAFVTGCGSAAEVVSRASIESSTNIAFIAAGEPKDRIHAYFEHYFDGVDRQVKTWNEQISALSGAAADLHRKGTERRQSTNDTLRNIIRDSMSPAKSRWPKSIEQRFKELGDPLGYRTIYARMSSEVHADAEETLRYLLGKLHGPQMLEAMALETVWTQRLYVHYALSWFLKASIIYATRYGIMDVANLLQKGFLDDVEKELSKIALHIGSGLLALRLPVARSSLFRQHQGHEPARSRSDRAHRA
jgi:Family of unknown function (DUF5677)